MPIVKALKYFVHSSTASAPEHQTLAMAMGTFYFLGKAWPTARMFGVADNAYFFCWVLYEHVLSFQITPEIKGLPGGRARSSGLTC